MLVITSENIPGKKFKVIGLVAANRSISILAKTEIYKVKNKLIVEAEALGADAIIAVRVFATANNSTAMYGTAVKYDE